MSTTYWQVAAGSSGRDYSDRFLQFGMAFVGGEQPIAKMQEVQAGDIVVLKKGKTKILAAGKIVQRNGTHRGDSRKDSDKEWLRDFDGWDLPAYCYVDWKKPNQPISTNGLGMSAIERLYKPELQDAANNILETGTVVCDSPEPSETRTVEDGEIVKFLIKQGLRPSSAGELTNTISKVRLLADYYYGRWENVGEHETRTFLVVPLLLALGWSEQQIKIELGCSAKRKVDIACFRKCYGGEKTECVTIIETKSFLSGLDYAPKQARIYSQDFPNCKVLIVTNGYCYKSYVRNENGQFQTSPSAYLNLLKPRDKYPLDPDNVGGVLDVIKWLLPNNLIS